MSSPKLLYLSTPQQRGLAATVVAGFFSAVSAFVLLVLLLLHVYRMWRHNRPILPITVFYLALLFWDIILAIGWIVNIQWIIRGQVTTGNFCVTQAIIQQLGGTGTALSIMAMSWCILHEYVIRAPGHLHSWTSAIGLGIISAIQVIDIALPNGLFHGGPGYYGIAGYWCWIPDEHFTAQVVTEYLWFWVAWVFSFLTAVAYSFRVLHNVSLPAGFLWIGFPVRGNKLLRLGLVNIDRNDHDRPSWSFSFEITFAQRTIRLMLPVPIQIVERPTAVNANPANANSTDAIRLLSFPLSYLVLIAPLSVARLMEFRHKSVGFGAVITAVTIFALEGFVDFLLFIWARPAFGIENFRWNI